MSRKNNADSKEIGAFIKQLLKLNEGLKKMSKTLNECDDKLIVKYGSVVNDNIAQTLVIMETITNTTKQRQVVKEPKDVVDEWLAMLED